LKGWWLPGDTTNLPKKMTNPRIVITHDKTSNSNKWYPTLAAYYLRSMGFSVLLNNLRDHGYSENTTHRFATWGDSYHFDVLGAWDYLKSDPDGLMGGALPASKVGVMGSGMGAFVSLNAFLLESQIPATWADSPLASTKELFNHIIRKKPAVETLFKIPGIEHLAWFWLKYCAHGDINDRTPLKDMKDAPNSSRPLQVVHNTLDEILPVAGAKEVVKTARKYPGKFDVKEPFYTNSTCNKETHIVSALLEPTPYREKLCAFWTGVFNVSNSLCGLGQLHEFKVAERRLSASAKDLDVITRSPELIV
jgi:hypothetical protein